MASVDKGSLSAGTVVKMPAFANLARAMAIPSMRWYSGTVCSSYSPPAALQAPPLGEQTSMLLNCSPYLEHMSEKT